MPDPHPLSVPVYQILLSLATGDAHGYALIRHVRERTGGEVDLTASTLYGALQRMLDDGWIAETGEEAGSEGPRRRVYTITAEGRRIATDEARRLQRAVRQAVEVRLLDVEGLRPRTP
jgi:DNA-binding PadR family transcriptional regulator